MSLARADLGKIINATGTGPFTSSSFTPTNSSLLVIKIYAQDDSGAAFAAADLALNSNTAGLTFTLRTEVVNTSAYGGGIRTYTAPVTTGVSMTINVGTATRPYAMLNAYAYCYTGYDTASPIGLILQSTAGPSSGAWSPGLGGTTAATSEVLAGVIGIINSGTGSYTPGTGWTEIFDELKTDYVIWQGQYKASSAVSTVDWADLTAAGGYYINPMADAMEIKAAGGIAIDASGNSGDVAAADNWSGSASWNGSDRILAINVPMLGPGVTVMAMNYGGAACTYVGSIASVTSFGAVEQWRICSSDSGAPAAGSNTLAVTLSGSIEFTVAWTSYTGSHQTVPTEAFNSAQATNTGSATNASVVITSIADNCWIHAACVANDTSIAAGNAPRNNVPGTLGSGANEDNGGAKTPAGAVTMSYTGMGITTTWAIAGYAIRPLAASGGDILQAQCAY